MWMPRRNGIGLRALPPPLHESLSRVTRAAVVLTCAWGIASSPLRAQSQSAGRLAPLRALSASLEQMASEVSPSVVQVMVTGYGQLNTAESGETGTIIGRQRTLGSGVIIREDGYIVTNAHVVAGAQRVQVVLHGAVTTDAVGQFLTGDVGRTMAAQIVGADQDIDLALLKVEAKGLRAMPFADYHKLRQGELVFAFGSPEGLTDSVTMGVVSAVARQTDPDSPTLYIQTDAPINRGNSGGPLVNVDGELVGLNTFILSESGGSQGLGFAIPSAVVAAAYPVLLKYGHLRRGVIGIEVQANSPDLAAGLQLPKTSGVIVADVTADSPADEAGVQPADIVTAVDGTPTAIVPMFGLVMSSHAPGDTVTLDLLRGSTTLSLAVPIVEESRSTDPLATLADPGTNSVPQLGIVGVDITDETASFVAGLRIPSGVFVAAREQSPQDAENPLTAGDIIHRVNSFSVRSLDGLRAILEGFKSRDRIVLQIERGGRLRFIVARLD
jgi:serine protease Do